MERYVQLYPVSGQGRGMTVKKQQLLTRLSEDSTLRTLCRAPLLLEMVCFLMIAPGEQENEASIRNLTSIYSTVVKRLSFSDDSKFDSTEVQVLLEAVAHTSMCTLGTNVFSEAQVLNEDTMLSLSRQHNRLALATAMARKSDMLLQAPGGKLSFLHKTFQEFFAAKFLTATSAEADGLCLDAQLPCATISVCGSAQIEATWRFAAGVLGLAHDVATIAARKQLVDQLFAACPDAAALPSFARFRAVCLNELGLEKLSAAHKQHVIAHYGTRYLSLLPWCAQIGASSLMREIVVGLNLKQYTDQSDESAWGLRALDVAAFSGHFECVRVLMTEGKAEVNLQDNIGRTALYAAADQGHSECVEMLLIEGKAEVNLQDNKGCTALHIAASQGHSECVRVLITGGKAEVNLQDINGCTALYAAAHQGHSECVEVLITQGKAEVNLQDNKGCTALYIAAGQGHSECVAVLITEGKAEVNSQDNIGRTALYAAAGQGHSECVRLLITEGKAAVNLQENEGLTALHAAAHQGRHLCVQLLIAEGEADTSIQDARGFTVLEHASLGERKMTSGFACVERTYGECVVQVLSQAGCSFTGAHGTRALQLAKAHNSESMISAILRARGTSLATQKKQKPNSKCACGSKKKYKKCCMLR
jgi:ankyrin repeat protein